MALRSLIIAALLTTGCDLYFADEPDEPNDGECDSEQLWWERFWIEEVMAPRSVDEAIAVAVDITGNGDTENLIGGDIARIQQVTSWQPAGELAPDRAWYISLQGCGDQVDGWFALETDNLDPLISEASGTIEDGAFILRGGVSEVPMGRILDPGGPRDGGNSDGAVLAFSPVLTGRIDGRELTGKIAFGVHTSDLEEVVAPALGAGMTRAAADDPDCDDLDCWFYDWDTSLDGLIAGWEVLQRRDIVWMGDPDLDLFDGAARRYGTDEILDSHSLTVRYRAIGPP